jgi:hypothetical protein
MYVKEKYSYIDPTVIAMAVKASADLASSQVNKQIKESEMIYNTGCIKPKVPKTFINKRKWEVFEKCLADKEKAKNDLERLKLEAERLRVEQLREEAKLKSNVELQRLKSEENARGFEASNQGKLLGLPTAITIGLGVVLATTIFIVIKKMN